MAAETVKGKRRYQVGAIEKSLFLISLLLDAQGGMTLTELSAAAGLTKNIIFRLLMTLERRGVLERDQQNRYWLGTATFVAARKVVSREGITIRRALEEVAGRLDEAAYFGRKSDGTAILVEMADCRQKVRARPLIGSALRDQGEEREMLDGVSIVAGALDPELTTVSIDVTAGSGLVCGSIVVVAPSYRMQRERILSEVVPALKEAVRLLPGVLNPERDREQPVVLQMLSTPVAEPAFSLNQLKQELCDDSMGGSNENSCLH